jgi:hypothetical protein
MAVVRRTLQRYNPLRHMPDEPFFYDATGSIAALYGLPGIEHHASASCNSQTQHAAPQYPAAYVPCSTSLTRFHVARRPDALFEKSCRSKKSSCVRQHAERKDYEVGLLKIRQKVPSPLFLSFLFLLLLLLRLLQKKKVGHQPQIIGRPTFEAP